MSVWRRLKLGSAKPDLQRSLVPEGHFAMGSEGESFDESPVHKVYVSAFEMAKTPVRNRDYALFLKEAGADPPPWWDDPAFDDPDQPAVGVNWHEARAFCDWLSQLSGLKIRLPTEAEFEKAARGGRRGCKYPWGNELATSGYVVSRGPLEGPYKPGTNPPNGYGLFDIVSNVHQWCLDGYDPDFYAASPERDPIAPGSTEQKAARGGTWKQEQLVVRCAERTRLAPYFRCDDFGIRWVAAYHR